MYLHTLRMSAVGPFAGDESIDFARLGSADIFLLEGPTGVGKSTIIDAIVYALYGSVAGSDASVERMRSELASPSTATSVELTFETTAGIFKVVRTPQYSRTKKRGEGVVVQPATVKLFRLGAPDSVDGELISNRQEEANEEIVNAIGLSKTQFTQTIVLPQGEFAEFLKAKPEERREVLQRIFGTKLYEDISEQLARQRQEALRQREQVERGIEDDLHVLAEVARCSGEEYEQLKATVGTADFEKGLAQVGDRVQVANSEAADSSAVAHAAQARATAALKEADRRNMLFSQRDTLLAESQELSNQQAEMDALRSQLTGLKSAATCSDALGKLKAARASLATKLEKVDQQAEQLRSEPLTAASIDAPDLAARALRDEAARLEGAVAIEKSLPESRRAIDSLEVKASEYAGSLELKETELLEFPQQRARLDEQITTQRAAGVRLPDLTRKVADLHARSIASKEATAAELKLEKLSQQVAASQKNVTTAATRVKATSDRWVGGIAGELAVKLEPDMPCLVCGSEDHPHPALPSPDAVSRADVDEAASVHSAAVEQLEAFRTSQQHAQLEHQRLTTKADGADPALAYAEYTAASDELAALTLAAEALTATEQELTRLETAERSTSEQRDGLRELRSTLTVQIKAATTQSQHDEKLVATSRGRWASVADRVQALIAAADAVVGFATTRGEADTAKERLAERSQDFAELLVRSSLDSEQSVESLLPAIAELPQLEESVEAYDARVATNVTRLESAELADLDDLTRPDSWQLTEALKQADVEANEALSAFATTKSQLAATTERTNAVLNRHRARAETFESTAPIIRVAGVANATSTDNLHKITLASFVLIDRFQRVVDAANSHLQRISDGQYQLERSQQPEPNGRKSGLGLEVRDGHTGHLRSPRDLSGGETFYTSLALALGLADIVTSENGGIELGTLFIDEGFGTLDNDRLEAVLAVIARQRNGGRVVGVVSHVEDLKIRIQNRVEVRRTATGSSTLKVVG